jgi:hypothetical protein
MFNISYTQKQQVKLQRTDVMACVQPWASYERKLAVFLKPLPANVEIMVSSE